MWGISEYRSTSGRSGKHPSPVHYDVLAAAYRSVHTIQAADKQVEKYETYS